MGAKKLFDAGYRLFPLEGRLKKPLLPGWQKATPSAKVLAHHLKKGNNLGVCLQDGQVVLDFDPRNFKDGVDDREMVELLFGIDLSNAPRVTTSNGGSHHYFTVPSGTRLRGNVAELPGLDIKQLGGFVVAPDSIHESTGHKYKIEGEWCDAPMLTVPDEWLRARPGEHVKDPGDKTAEWLETYLGNMEPTDFGSGRYEEWIKLLTACHHATGGCPAAREVFTEWSQGDEEYADRDEETRYKWEACRLDRVGGATVATLHYFAKEFGFEVENDSIEDDFDDFFTEPGEGDILPTGFEDVWSDIRSGISFSKKGVENSIRNVRYLVKKWNEHAKWTTDIFSGREFTAGDSSFCKKGQEWTDGGVLVFRGQTNDIFSDWDLPIVRVHEAVDELLAINKVHPVVDWLKSLKWDGKTRMDTWLIDYLGVTHPSQGNALDIKYVKAVGRLILDAMVARVTQPGVKFDYMFILEGPQGIGKSSVCKILASEEWFTDTVDLSQNAKDIIPVLQGNWVVEFPELDGLRKSDVRQLKSFITTQVDTARLAYGRKKTSIPRQSILMGTTNDATYLSDDTGGRRFLPIPMGQVQFKGLENARDQLLAEAYAKRNEARLILDPWCEQYVDTAREERMIQDPLMLAIDEMLHDLEEKEIDSLSIMRVIGAKPGETHKSRRIASIMRNKGWQKMRLHRVDPETKKIYRPHGYKRVD